MVLTLYISLYLYFFIIAIKIIIYLAYSLYSSCNLLKFCNSKSNNLLITFLNLKLERILYSTKSISILEVLFIII